MKISGKKFFLKLRSFVGIMLIFALCALYLVHIGSNEAYAKASKEQFEIGVSYGYNDKIQGRAASPYRFIVQNNGGNFEGSLQLLVYGNDKDVVMYEKSIAIAAGQKKKVSLVADNATYTKYATVKMVDKKGKTVYSEPFKLDVLNNLDEVNVGILSDDFMSFAYLSGSSFDILKGYTTHIYELDETSIIGDAKEFEMLDAIIICDYSTDKLSSKQMDAIMEWTKKGGLLIVSAGSTYAKTFSGLKDRIPWLTKGTLEKKAIDFGYSGFSYFINNNIDASTYKSEEETQAERAAMLNIDPNAYVDLIGDDSKLADAIYADNSGIFLKYMWSYMHGETYEEAQKWYDQTYLETCSEEVKDYCMKNVLPSLCQYVKSSLNNEEIVSRTNEYVETELYTSDNKLFYSLSNEKEKAVMLEPINGKTGDEYGENVNSIRIGATQEIGEGRIVLLGYDISKNPFITYGKNDDMPKNAGIINTLISQYKGADIYNEFQNYGPYRYGGYYNPDIYESVARSLSIMESPSLILYFFLFLIYIGIGIALYVVLKKKRRSVWFWGAQTAVAVAFVVIVGIVGSLSKTGKPYVQTMRINVVGDTGIEEINTMSLLLSGSKNLTMEFDPEYDVSILTTDSYFSTNTYNSAPSEYSLAYLDKPDAVGIRFVNEESVNQRPLIARKIIDQKVNVEKKLTRNENEEYSFSFTNNFDKDFEKVILQYEDKFVYIGDIKAGEKVSIDWDSFNARIYGGRTVPKLGDVFHANYSSYQEFFNNQKDESKMVLFGVKISSKYRPSARRACINYINGNGYYKGYSPYTGEAKLIAFSRDEAKATIHEGDCTELLEEMYVLDVEIEDIGQMNEGGEVR